MEPPATIVFLRDRFVDDPAQAQVSLFDRGYLLGDGLFETVRAYGGRLFRAERHVARLVDGAGRLEIALPFGADEILEIAREAARRARASDVYLRITVSRGEGGAGVAFTGTERATFSVIAKPWAGYPAQAHEQGLVSGLVTARRIPAVCLPPDLKTANYLPNVLARRELDRRGMLEGVVLSVDGHVVSGTVSNVFVVRGATLITPHAASGCRPGITREAVLELAAALALDVEEREVQREELSAADEIFFVNTLMECLFVASFDGRVLTGGCSITKRIRGALRDLVQRETRPG